jgi:MFS family permease
MQVLMSFGLTYIEPTTELFLLQRGVEEENSGYWFSISNAAYALSSFMVPFFPVLVAKSKIMAFGNLVQTLGFILIGPVLLYVNDSLDFLVMGLFAIGLAAGFIYVPSMPHMLETLKLDFEYKNDNRVNNAVASITAIALSTGEVIGPIIASMLYQFMGYNNAAALVSIVVFFHCLVYLILAEINKRKLAKELGFELMELSPH